MATSVVEDLSRLIRIRDANEVVMDEARANLEEADASLDAIRRKKGKGDAWRTQKAIGVANDANDTYDRALSQFNESLKEVARALESV